MTYAPTVRYLEEKALEAGAASFWFGKQQTQSINYNAPFPQVHLFLLPAALVGYNVVYEVRMCFYGPDQHENAANLAEPATANESLAIQDAMDILSQTFIGLLYDDDQFELSDRINRAPVLREGSQIGTGFFVSFTLTAHALC